MSVKWWRKYSWTTNRAAEDGSQSEVTVTLIHEHCWVNHMWFDQLMLVKTDQAVVWSHGRVTQTVQLEKLEVLQIFMLVLIRLRSVSQNPDDMITVHILGWQERETLHTIISCCIYTCDSNHVTTGGKHVIWILTNLLTQAVAACHSQNPTQRNENGKHILNRRCKLPPHFSYDAIQLSVFSSALSTLQYFTS